MGITIELRPELEAQLAREAAVEGIPLNKYVENLVQQHSIPASKTDNSQALQKRLFELARKWHSLPTLDQREPDEIIAYNDFGLPAR